MPSSSSSSVLTMYSYAKDVAGFDISQLTYEIEQNGTITTQLSHIHFKRPDLSIFFVGDLSSAEQDELDTVVANSPDSSLIMPQEDSVANVLVVE